MASGVTFILILLALGQQITANDAKDSSACEHEAAHTECKRGATVSATLQVSTADIVNSASSSETPVNATKGCATSSTTCCGDTVTILRSIQESLETIKTALKPGEPEVAEIVDAPVQYPLLHQAGARWRLFWWFTAGTTWPTTVTDVLQDRYGDCDPTADYCFGRFPEALQETSAEMLGTDTAGNVYRWQFDPQNAAAHAVWRAFHDHVEVRVINGGRTWNPTTVQGASPKRPQDSFQYRMEHGVKSLSIDDDGCDCYTSLSLGHGMCNEGFSREYGPENVFGVDLLFDSYCQTPSPSNGLYLYFRDEDDCTNVECPAGFECIDGVSSYSCRRK